MDKSKYDKIEKKILNRHSSIWFDKKINIYQSIKRFMKDNSCYLFLKMQLDIQYK